MQEPPATATIGACAPPPRDLVQAVRDLRRLREEGESYGDIAQACGLTRSRVVQLLQRTVPRQRPELAHSSGTESVGSGTGSEGSRPPEPDVLEDGDGEGDALGPGWGATGGAGLDDGRGAGLDEG